MRDFSFLPYEKAIEEMAREYAKVRPVINIIENRSEDIEPPTPDNLINLENTYCYNLEMLILIRQLKYRVNREELIGLIDRLIDFKTNSINILDAKYIALSGKSPVSPAVMRFNTPALLRRLICLQAQVGGNIKCLLSEYSDLSSLQSEEIQAAILLDNIVLIITAL